jgi:hypothetical protein
LQFRKVASVSGHENFGCLMAKECVQIRKTRWCLLIRVCSPHRDASFLQVAAAAELE